MTPREPWERGVPHDGKTARSSKRHWAVLIVGLLLIATTLAAAVSLTMGAVQ